MEQFERSELLLGSDSTNILKQKKVAVFGVGGVGSYALEALCRAGVGELCLVDSDRYQKSNMNRQLHATLDTLGKLKVEVAKERILKITPQCTVETKPVFFDENTDFDFKKYDYIVDAIDSVKSKTLLIKLAKQNGVNIISSMGAGNKLDPTAFRVADIYETSVCPLARVMRKRLKAEGVDSLKVVFSAEAPIIPTDKTDIPGSVPFVPSVAGLIIAGEVIKDLVNTKDSRK